MNKPFVALLGNSHRIQPGSPLTQTIEAIPHAPLQVDVVNKDLFEPAAKPTTQTLTQKFKTYDPAIYGSELKDGDAVGAEFGAPPQPREKQNFLIGVLNAID